MTWLRSFGGIVIAVVVGWAWLSLIHDPSIRHAAAARAHLDSLQARADSTTAVAAARDSTARADSLRRARDLAAAHQVTVAIAQQANALVPRVRASVVDSLRPVFDSLVRDKDSTIASVERERDGEHARWVAALTEVAFYRDSVAPKLRRDLADALKQAKQNLARANRHWHLGGVGGFGATASGGRVYAGPTLGVGLVYTP